MKKILITGGAGYIGSVLVRLLLNNNFKVRILDNLMFGGESLLGLLDDPGFEFINGDIRVVNDIRKALQGVDYVVNLAAIVGDPACKKFPDLAEQTNLKAVKNLYKIANERGVKRFIFASTCSNYGKSNNPDELLNEESDLAPVSLYAETKVEAEKFLLLQSRENVTKPTCLRFSTVYGISPRIRFDLTVNEFTKEVMLGRELLIFGEQFWRPYCHVFDLARSVLVVLEAETEKVSFEVFNVGNTEENYQKQMIAKELLKVIPEARIKYIKKDEDPRDYKVSFEKIKNQLGYKTTKKVSDGILEVKKVIESGLISDPDNSKYKNI